MSSKNRKQKTQKGGGGGLFRFRRRKEPEVILKSVEYNSLLQPSSHMSRFSDGQLNVDSQFDSDLLEMENSKPRDSVQSKFLDNTRKTMTKSLTMDLIIFNYLKEEKGEIEEDFTPRPIPAKNKPARQADSMNDFGGLDMNPALANAGSPYRNTTANLSAKLEIKRNMQKKRGFTPLSSVGKGFSRIASFFSPRKTVKGVGSVFDSFRSSFNFRSSWGGSTYEDNGTSLRDKLGNDDTRVKEDDEITDLSGGSDLDTDLLTVTKKGK